MARMSPSPAERVSSNPNGIERARSQAAMSTARQVRLVHFGHELFGHRCGAEPSYEQAARRQSAVSPRLRHFPVRSAPVQSRKRTSPKRDREC
jgi:hypothetical protein